MMLMIGKHFVFCFEQTAMTQIGGLFSFIFLKNTQDPLKEVAALQLSQSHPNVEELEEAMTDGTNLYKVTPWYEGGELFDLAPVPEQSAKMVFAQLLDALEFLHSRGECFFSCFFWRGVYPPSRAMPPIVCFKYFFSSAVFRNMHRPTFPVALTIRTLCGVCMSRRRELAHVCYWVA